jgi:glucosylceramidase
MEGVGAALTDSSAYLMTNKLSGSARSSLINDLFGMTGANLNYVRLPLSSSDMSTEDFTHDD